MRYQGCTTGPSTTTASIEYPSAFSQPIRSALKRSQMTQDPRDHEAERAA